MLVHADGAALAVQTRNNLRFPEHLRLLLGGLFQGTHIWVLRLLRCTCLNSHSVLRPLGAPSHTTSLSSL